MNNGRGCGTMRSKTIWNGTASFPRVHLAKWSNNHTKWTCLWVTDKFQQEGSRSGRNQWKTFDTRNVTSPANCERSKSGKLQAHARDARLSFPCSTWKPGILKQLGHCKYKTSMLSSLSGLLNYLSIYLFSPLFLKLTLLFSFQFCTWKVQKRGQGNLSGLFPLSQFPLSSTPPAASPRLIQHKSAPLMSALPVNN